MQQRNEVHYNLTAKWDDAGQWKDPDLGKVIPCVGLFEKISLLIREDGFCNLKLLDQLDGHRIAAIASNPCVQKRFLVSSHETTVEQGWDEAEGWKELIGLYEASSDERKSVGEYYRMGYKKYDAKRVRRRGPQGWKQGPFSM